MVRKKHAQLMHDEKKQKENNERATKAKKKKKKDFKEDLLDSFRKEKDWHHTLNMN